MRVSNLLAVSLLLLSPVAYLVSYLKQRPEPTAVAPVQSTQPTQPIPSPSPDLSPLRTIPSPRQNQFPQANYLLPPVIARKSNSSWSRLPQATLPRVQSKALDQQVERSLWLSKGGNDTDNLDTPWLTGDLDSSLVVPAKATMPSLPSRVSVTPPSAAMMAMTPPGLGQRTLEQAGSPSEPDQIAFAPDTTLDNSTSAVFSQDGSNQLRQQLLIEPLAPTSGRRQLGRVVGAPAITLSTPTGYGARFGQLFAGVSVINRGRYNNNPDGSATVGFGLGDPRRAIGLDVAANVISLSDSNGQDAFAGSGNVGFKLHRILPGEIAVAVGWENALAWGDARNVDSSVYGVVSRAFPLQPNNYRNPMPLILSVGLGGGRFRSEQEIRNREGGLGLFASAGLQLSPQFSLLANWTGQDLNVGASFIPFLEIPFSLTLSAADLTGSAGDGARFALGLGYGTRFNF